jgi:hypothetical protein
MAASLRLTTPTGAASTLLPHHPLRSQREEESRTRIGYGLRAETARGCGRNLQTPARGGTRSHAGRARGGDVHHASARRPWCVAMRKGYARTAGHRTPAARPARSASDGAGDLPPARRAGPSPRAPSGRWRSPELGQRDRASSSRAIMPVSRPPPIRRTTQAGEACVASVNGRRHPPGACDILSLDRGCGAMAWRPGTRSFPSGTRKPTQTTETVLQIER